MKVGKPIIIPIEGFHLPYITPPMPELKDIDGYNLKRKDQKWTRKKFLSDEDFQKLTRPEQVEIIKTDLLRRMNGYWFMNNGEPTYITGSHYFTLTHWFMAAVNLDGYPEYRSAARIWFYVKDIADRDENCFGLIMMCQKRFGKTEYELADLYNKATRGASRWLKGMFVEDSDCLFGLQSLTAQEAKNNLFKSRLMRSHMRIHNYLKPVSNETNSRKEIVGELTFKGENLGDGKYKDALRNVIDHRPTLVSAYQGKRPRQIFIDEPGSIEEMNLIEWWTTVKQQLALGTKAFGKAFLPTTLESMTPKGAGFFKEIWGESDADPKELDANGRTKSGLYRYFKAQYLGREDFIDEYGNDMIEAAKQFRANELSNASPERKRKIKRQYPETVEEAFDIQFGGGIEADCLEILKDRLEQLKDTEPPIYRATLYESMGDLKIKTAQITKKDRQDMEDDVVRIFEHPLPNVQYRVGVDGTATDKETSTTQTDKSKYSVTVTKLFDPNQKNSSYCDVAEYVIRPERMEECYRITTYLVRYYNKFGNCKVLPEGNAGNAAPIVAFFRNKGILGTMLKEPKYAGSDSREVKDRYCFYRDANCRRTQLDLLNSAIRMYGHSFNSERLILDLIKVGNGNTDLADSLQAAILAWGGFTEPKKEEASEKRMVGEFNQQTGAWEWREVEQKSEAA